jgi:hypothetical protein
LWLGVCALQRLILLPAALGPVLLPETPDLLWVWVLIGLTAANHGMINFSTPLWLSWMGDYLPRDGLSRYWGVRHLWMQWSAVLSLLVAALFLLGSGLDVRTAFAVLVGIGAVFGVADILMFFKVDEPPIRPLPDPKLSEVFASPFRHAGFRSFIAYGCFWHFAAMVGAPFISLFLLSHVGMSLFHVLLLWAASWVGGALLSARLGEIVEEFGNRPVLVAATGFKAINMTALLLVPVDPTVAFWVLVPVFMVDAVLNAAIAIASNGFMLKNSPVENRSMYIAAGTAIAGMTGGLTSIVAGGVLSLLDGSTVSLAGRELNGFHLLFSVSLLLRLVSMWFAVRVKEPEGRPTVHVLVQLIGMTPLRFMRFPLGLYRSRFGGVEPDEAAPDAADGRDDGTPQQPQPAHAGNGRD